jgi:DNA polymerase II small subunit/DNA polymerase delta subunit B
MIEHPETKIQLRKYKNNTLASLAGMVAELDSSVVDDLKDLKTFVINGLIKEATMSDKSKERITALRAIGEVDGVDAFKKHTEVVHKNMSLDDIEDRLKVLVGKLQKRLDIKDSEVVDAEVVKDE